MTGEQTPGTNLGRSHITAFLTSVWQHVPQKINMGFAVGSLKFGESKCLFGEHVCFHVKEFRTTVIYRHIYIYT